MLMWFDLLVWAYSWKASRDEGEALVQGSISVLGTRLQQRPSTERTSVCRLSTEVMTG